MWRNSLLFRTLHWAEWWEATLFTTIKRFLCSINPSKTEVKPAAPSTLKESLDRNSRLSCRAVRPEVASNSYSFAESATMKRTVNSTRNMKVNIIWATKTTWSFNLSGKACKDYWNIWHRLGHLWLQSIKRKALGNFHVPPWFSLKFWPPLLPMQVDPRTDCYRLQYQNLHPPQFPCRPQEDQMSELAKSRKHISYHIISYHTTTHFILFYPTIQPDPILSYPIMSYII